MIALNGAHEPVTDETNGAPQLQPDEVWMEKWGPGTYLFEWRRRGYRLRLERVRETYHGLKGVMFVETIALAPENGRPRHLFYGDVTLSKAPEKAVLSELCRRDDRMPWADMLEVARVQTARDVSAGEPTVVLADVELADEEDLVEGMLPLGETSVLFGDGMAGKSYLAIALALAVATGKPVGPFRPLQAGPVLVLDWETKRQTWKKRLWRVAQGAGLAIPRTIHYRYQSAKLVDDVERVRSDCARLGVVLVIVDSIALAVGGEVTADSVMPFYNALRSLEGISRNVLSHVSKTVSVTSGVEFDPYGSIFVKNYARSVWGVRKDEIANADGGFDAVLTHRKVNESALGQPIGLRFRFDDANKRTGPVTIERIDALAEPGLVVHAKTDQRWVAALRRGQRSTGELATEMDKKTNQIRTEGLRLLKKGVVVRVGEEHWGLSTPQHNGATGAQHSPAGTPMAAR